jgi:uncharacterized protein (DUF58 family)
MFEDPSRKKGTREYYRGDALNRINWKASARTGRLRVNLYETTISMGTVVFLNLNLSDYANPVVYYTELAITVAASIANYIYTIGQEVGLVTNGFLRPPLDDAFGQEVKSPTLEARDEAHLISIPMGKGYGQLIEILRSLAVVEARPASPLLSLLSAQRLNLSWGTTLIFITPDETDGLIPRLAQYRRLGYNVVLIILQGTPDGASASKERCKEQNITFYHIRWESDMDVWKEPPRWKGKD